MKHNIVCGLVFGAFMAVGSSAHAAQYLVEATDGPTLNSPEQAVQMLEGQILPTFEALEKLEKDHKVVGGLPVGARALTFMLEAASNEEVDQILRDLPAWPQLKWKVTPLQSFSARNAKETAVVADLKKGAKEKAK